MEPHRPKSIEEAVEMLLTDLSESDRQAIRMMSEEQLSSLHSSLGNHIRNGFGLWGSNARRWQELTGDLSNDFKPDDVPWWYNERAWVGALAAATWKAGGRIMHKEFELTP